MQKAPKQLMDRRTQATFVAAIVFLAAMGLFQLLLFTMQQREARSTGAPLPPEVVVPGIPQAAAPQPDAGPETSLSGRDPAEALRENDLITTETFRESTPVLIETLLKQARELRFEGKHIEALLRLREARLIDPRHPLVLAEIAATYERMDDPDQARVFWQELEELGESAGVVRELARQRLGGRGVPTGSLQPGQPFATAAAALNADLDEKETSINPDAIIRFRDISEERNEAPEGDVFITLRLEVEAREDVPVLPRSIYVLVLFYEIIDGRDIVPTSARVNHHWVSLPADWAGEARVEILEVDYHLDTLTQPETEPADEAPPADDPERRKYYGYIARLYYDNALQDFSADPVSLLNLFPPSNVLPTEQ